MKRKQVIAMMMIATVAFGSLLGGCGKKTSAEPKDEVVKEVEEEPIVEEEVEEDVEVNTSSRLDVTQELYEYAGSPVIEEEVEVPYIDVAEENMNTVKWAISNSLYEGMEEGFFGEDGTTFTPDVDLNREQSAQVIKNFVVSVIGADLGIDGIEDLSALADADSIKPEYVDAVKFVTGYGILGLDENSNFNPQTAITEEEVETIVTNVNGMYFEEEEVVVTDAEGNEVTLEEGQTVEDVIAEGGSVVKPVIKPDVKPAPAPKREAVTPVPTPSKPSKQEVAVNKPTKNKGTSTPEPSKPTEENEPTPAPQPEPKPTPKPTPAPTPAQDPTPAPAPVPEPTPAPEPEPERVWVEGTPEEGHYEKVEISPAFDKPIKEDADICNGCGKVLYTISNGYSSDQRSQIRIEHFSNSNGKCNSWHTAPVDSGKFKHYDAIYEDKWVVDKPATEGHWETR